MSLVKKVFDYSIWIMFFGLLLLGGIIFVSNRIYPGDKLYPLKLKFESFILATSKILNKQVDFSIDLVSKRSNEVAKTLTPKNSEETLNRLDTQVELTATSISQISDPIEKKKAAEKYIVKLNEVSSVLSEKQKEFIELQSTTQTVQPTVQPQQPVQNIPIKPTASQNIIPTAVPTTVPTPTSIPITTTNNTRQTVQQINNTQQTVQQTINEMTNLATNNDIAPTENNQQKDKLKDQKDSDSDKKNENQEKNKIKND